MADHYIAWPLGSIPGGDLLLNDVVIGTSSSSASLLEVRWGDGIKRKELMLFLEAVERLLVNGGKLHDGAGVPPPG